MNKLYYTNIHLGLDELRALPDFVDYTITPSLYRKIVDLSIVDEGVYFFVLLGYLNQTASGTHPLYNGQNRVYTAYLTGHDRLNEVVSWLQSKKMKMTLEVRESLVFMMAYQQESTFALIAENKKMTALPWDFYLTHGQYWIYHREKFIDQIVDDHQVIYHHAYKETLLGMVDIIKELYGKKTFAGVTKVFESRNNIAKLRG